MPNTTETLRFVPTLTEVVPLHGELETISPLAFPAALECSSMAQANTNETAATNAPSPAELEAALRASMEHLMPQWVAALAAELSQQMQQKTVK